jgi:uncharacterized protein
LRYADEFVQRLVEDEPAVMLEGPRGSGKSTVLREIASRFGGTVVDLDDAAVLAQIHAGSDSILRSEKLVAIDEFQRAPEVLIAVKRIVDREGWAGRFLLAGSVSDRLLPKGSETLTGRVHRMQLLPLSAGELLGQTELWLRDVLEGNVPKTQTQFRRDDIFMLMIAGGYPGALQRPTESLMRRWHASYLSTVADRDLPSLVDIRRSGALGRLYRLLASRTATVANVSELAGQLNLTPQTTRHYIDLLERCFLIRELPSWSIGLSAREARRPKIHFTDTGLVCAAMGFDAAKLARHAVGGQVAETFVLTELLKQAAVVDQPLSFSHFRDRTGLEVDIIMERPDGAIVAVEVKASIQVGERDTRSLRFLRDRLGDRFLCGVVLHTGPLTLNFGDRIFACPIAALWGGKGTPFNGASGPERNGA